MSVFTQANLTGIFAVGQNVAEHYGVFIPNGALTTIAGIRNLSVDSIIEGVVETAQELAYQNKKATAIYCAGVAIANPSEILQMLNNIGCNMAGTMSQILNNVMTAVQQQINLAVDTVIGSAGKAVNAALALINSILELVDTILGLFDGFVINAKLKRQNRLTADKCLDMVADILSCLLNKYLGDPLEKFQNKMIKKIKEKGMKWNQALSDEFADLDVLSNYVQREAFFLNKANILMSGIFANFDDVDTAAEQNAAKNASAQAGDVKVAADGTVTVVGTNAGQRADAGSGTSDGNSQPPITSETDTNSEQSGGLTYGETLLQRWYDLQKEMNYPKNSNEVLYEYQRRYGEADTNKLLSETIVGGRF